MYIGFHVKCTLFLLDFSETRIFSTYCRKIVSMKFRENPSSGSPAVPCGRTDVTRLSSFSQFTECAQNFSSPEWRRQKTSIQHTEHYNFERVLSDCDPFVWQKVVLCLHVVTSGCNVTNNTHGRGGEALSVAGGPPDQLFTPQILFCWLTTNLCQ